VKQPFCAAFLPLITGQASFAGKSATTRQSSPMLPCGCAAVGGQFLVQHCSARFRKVRGGFPMHGTVSAYRQCRIANHVNFYQDALTLRTQRQELLASNIANADTPHFKAKDMDFKEAMRSAQGRNEMAEPLPLQRTNAGHLAGFGYPLGDGAIKYRVEYQGAVDGNTVNMDVERAAFTENAVNAEALITFINRRFSGLESAIKGQ